MKTQIRPYILWVLKGAAMGAADAVPGVSGGTIALITGIYERFIAALAAFNPSLFGYFRNRDFKGLWQAIDGAFLLSLGIGILVSLFSMLNLMHWLLENAAPVVWSFFMGIILVSIWQLSRNRRWLKLDLLLLAAGTVIAFTLILVGSASVNAADADSVVSVTPALLVFGGALAISAMLLPGVSGSFMLVLLGLYQPVVDAVHARDIIVVLWVALGCLIGILGFSRFLKWVLQRWHDRVISFMLGFVCGALVKVWPWQLNGRWLTPESYSLTANEPAFVVLAVVALLAGVVLVLSLRLIGRKF